MERSDMPSAMRTARELAEVSSWSASARRLAANRPDATIDEFFAALLDERLLADAILVLPHLVSKRRAIWWGCLCAWRSNRMSTASADFDDALEAALAWVLRPSDANRRAALPVATKAGMKSSAGCLAWATFWTAGSMLDRDDVPTVRPPETLTANVVGGAVQLAAVEWEPMRHDEHYGEFLALGVEVADGKLPWSRDVGVGAEFDPARASFRLDRPPGIEIGTSESQAPTSTRVVPEVLT